jgi:tRNA1Val (adenine37-N6)-methyltransferase
MILPCLEWAYLIIFKYNPGGVPRRGLKPMANPYFTFRQFTVWHDQCAMKVGTDGVLLGAWTCVQGADYILDAGTGSGLIAIMLAQRSSARIEAVEIEYNAYRQAVENSAACPWNERIRVHHISCQHFANSPDILFDLVVSNPPYFRDSLKPPVHSRSLARHGDMLTYEEVLVSTARLLSPEGRLSVILPAKEQDHFTNLAFFHGFYPSRFLMIRPGPGKAYSRCLAEFNRHRNNSCTREELSIKKENGTAYSDEYISLTREYYLFEDLKI